MAIDRRQISPYWREAATLILAAPHRDQESCTNNTSKGDDFEVLMLKRDAASSFMPNAFVYPGGMRSPADFDRKRWNSIFQRNANISIESLENMLEISGERSPMLLPNSEQDADELSADVGYVLFERHLKRVAFYWYHTRMTWQQTLSAAGIHIPQYIHYQMILMWKHGVRELVRMPRTSVSCVKSTMLYQIFGHCTNGATGWHLSRARLKSHQLNQRDLTRCSTCVAWIVR